MTHRESRSTLRTQARQALVALQCLLTGHNDVTPLKVCRCTAECRYCLRCGRTEHITSGTDPQ